jgi:hypothetical protein
VIEVFEHVYANSVEQSACEAGNCLDSLKKFLSFNRLKANFGLIKSSSS